MLDLCQLPGTRVTSITIPHSRFDSSNLHDWWLAASGFSTRKQSDTRLQKHKEDCPQASAGHSKMNSNTALRGISRKSKTWCTKSTTKCVEKTLFHRDCPCLPPIHLSFPSLFSRRSCAGRAAQQQADTLASSHLHCKTQHVQSDSLAFHCRLSSPLSFVSSLAHTIKVHLCCSCDSPTLSKVYTHCLVSRFTLK